jgi:hypothetical protein
MPPSKVKRIRGGARVGFYSDQGCKVPLDLNFGTVDAGDKKEIKVFIKNEGKHQIRDVEVDLQLPDSYAVFPDKMKLKPGEVGQGSLIWEPNSLTPWKDLTAKLKVRVREQIKIK